LRRYADPKHAEAVFPDRTTLVDRYVTELILLAKGSCPDAILEVLSTRYEDEDAHILVYPPEGTSDTDMDRLGDALTERSVEILLDTGLLILIGVYEAAQRRQGIEKPPTIP
jgi:hypothetical protein